MTDLHIGQEVWYRRLHGTVYDIRNGYVFVWFGTTDLAFTNEEAHTMLSCATVAMPV